jgi:hypothetical protein
LVELFGERTPAERVAIYVVSKGRAAYLELFTRTGDFVSALYDYCLVPNRIILADPALILQLFVKDQGRKPMPPYSLWWPVASTSGEKSLAFRLAQTQDTPGPP